MKVLVCGDRNWRDWYTVYTKMLSLKDTHGPYLVIEGGAPGVDSLGHRCARALELEVQTFKAQWDVYGRKAGPIRNRLMLDQQPDLVLAFHSDLDKSRGTKDCVNEARLRGIPVEVIPAAGQTGTNVSSRSPAALRQDETR